MFCGWIGWTELRIIVFLARCLGACWCLYVYARMCVCVCVRGLARFQAAHDKALAQVYDVIEFYLLLTTLNKMKHKHIFQNYKHIFLTIHGALNAGTIGALSKVVSKSIICYPS